VGAAPAFAQIYVHEPDPEQQVNYRMRYDHDNLDRAILRELQDMLYQSTNPFVTAFRTAGERLAAQENIALKLKCVTAPRLDQRHNNRPNVHEVAAILVGSDTHPSLGMRDIIIQERSGRLKRISDLHSSYPYKLRECAKIVSNSHNLCTYIAQIHTHL
jgi:hypothetical protein